MRALLATLLLAGLAACATLPPPEVNLRLAPAALGSELALQQRMTVTVAGRSQQLDVLIEADAQGVRLAVMDFGQVVARLEWDGTALVESRAEGWPAAVSGARVLSDLQLVHWPLPAIAAGLPPGWSVHEEDAGRLVRSGDRVMVRIAFPAAGSAELDNLAAGYRIRLETFPAGPVR